MKSKPRLINELEGGPSRIYVGKSPRDKVSKQFVYYGMKDHQMLRDLKLTLNEDAISWETMPLYELCEECEECNPQTCPKPIEEVMEKGSGMKQSEVLEGWFIDLGKCEPWKVCECCHGKGYIT